MAYDLSEKALAYIADHKEDLVALIETLCKIPSPSHHEEKRAAFIKQWLEDRGAKGVVIDEAFNVIYPVNCEGRSDIAAFLAHIDTVFPDMEPFTVTREGDKMYCPGVGDDTTNVAIIMLIAQYLLENHLEPTRGILFVLNAGEEGLGNLKGTRNLMKTYGHRITEFVSFDGHYTDACNSAVGSTRYKVTVRTEGGHSYGKFGNANAIAYLASIINTLYSAKIPAGGKTTFNVGVIEGGTSINTIAQEASMLYEFRSDIKENLDAMMNMFDHVMDTYRAMGIDVEVEVLGQRPCMGDVDPVGQKRLEEKTLDIIEKYYGKRVPLKPGSTDCNIPFSMGIPGICYGGYIGKGAHTRGEWIDLTSLDTGFKICMASVLDYFH